MLSALIGFIGPSMVTAGILRGQWSHTGPEPVPAAIETTPKGDAPK